MESESYKNLLYARTALPEFTAYVCRHEPRDIPPRDIPQGVSGFLAWLMLWFRLCVERSGRRAEQINVRAYEPNRFSRRRRHHSVVPVRNNRPYYIFARSLTCPSLSPTQFMERVVALSGRGRVSVYRMRYWRKTVKGKAAPLGTEHEYWRDPILRMGKLLCGVWAAHLWPGWRLLFPN